MRLEDSVRIDRPVEDVFSFSADVDNLPLWLNGVIDANKLTDGPLRVGAQLEHVLQLLGKRFTSRFEVTEYEENRRMRFRTIAGPVDMDTVQTMTPVEGGGTVVTQVVEGDPRGLFKVAEPVLEKIVDRQMQHSLENLRDVLEAG